MGERTGGIASGPSHPEASGLLREGRDARAGPLSEVAKGPTPDHIAQPGKAQVRAESDRRPTTMTGRTLVGLRWSYLAAAANAITQVIYVATMSRLLTSVAFGLMAMAQIAVNFGQHFTRMGVAHALVQKPDISAEEVRASWTSGILLGGICAAAFYALAPAIGDLYNNADVVPVLRALSVNFVLLGLSTTSQALLRRSMRFRNLAMISLTTALAGAVVGVGLAMLGAGVYSLVGATIAAGTLQVAQSYASVRHPLRPILRWHVMQPLYSFGTRVSLLRLTEFLGKNLDTIAVGRYLTASVTGVYSRTYTLVSLPLSRYLSEALAKVLFPSFSAIQKDRQRLRRAFSSILLIVSLILLPIGAGMAITAPEMVATVLGTQFTEGAVLVPFFALAAILHILSHIAQLLCEAVAELNRTAAVQILHLLVLAALLLTVAGQPVWVFAAVLAAAEAIRHVFYLMLMRRVVGMRLRDFAQAYGSAALVAGVVAGVLFLGRRGLLALEVLPVPVVFAAEVGLGAVALAGAVRLLPLAHVRREIWMRTRAAGLDPEGGRATARLARLVLGRPGPQQRAQRAPQIPGAHETRPAYSPTTRAALALRASSRALSTRRARGGTAEPLSRNHTMRRAGFLPVKPVPQLTRVIPLAIITMLTVVALASIAPGMAERLLAALPLLAIAVVGALLGLYLLEALIHRSVLAAALLLSYGVLDAAFGADLPRLALGGVTVYIADVLFALITAAAAARHLRLGRFTAPSRALLLLGCVGLLSLARGVLEVGLEPAVNDFRAFLGFIGTALYFSTINDATTLRRIVRIYVVAAVGLVGVVFVRWAALLTGVDLGPLGAEYDAAIRVLSGSETFFLSQAVFLFLPALIRGGLVERALGCGLLLTVVALNRRTVWLALVIGAVVIGLRNPVVRRRMTDAVVAVAVLVALVLSVLLLMGPLVGSSTGPTAVQQGDGPVAQSVTDTGTLQWRITGWQALVAGDEDDTAIDWLFGRPMGSGYERTIAGQLVDVQPHNFYLQILLRLGIVGLVVLLALYVLVMRRLLRMAPTRDHKAVGLATSQVLLVILAAQVVWLITWSTGPEQSMILGLAAGYAFRRVFAPAAPHPQQDLPSPTSGDGLAMTAGEVARST